VLITTPFTPCCDRTRVKGKKKKYRKEKEEFTLLSFPAAWQRKREGGEKEKRGGEKALLSDAAERES